MTTEPQESTKLHGGRLVGLGGHGGGTYPPDPGVRRGRASPACAAVPRVAAMDVTQVTRNVYTPFAELDLLLSEEEQDAAVIPSLEVGDVREPETVDAFNAQILAGLVSP